ncbi:FHA domain-containing protein [Stratiformator vulcanicus]|uniref:FHA domain protein n=1 Tax=Stratiformator vulcanicus TaxID=2527980 RepID=A0A517R459_9PLAN|nr:FHA domain-containing protein [Stratiformator vulcanicus]QDT38656.1 FHA domain protein [Stratiformator vulcanicus]
MHGELIPIGGGDPVPLVKQELTIGRRRTCDIVLEYPKVSGEHCILEIINGYWKARDNHSQNGTKVNGERIDEHWLMPGDTLTIARKFTYEIQYEPMSSERPQDPQDDQERSLIERAGIERRSPSRSGRPAERTRERDPMSRSWGDDDEEIRRLLDD